MKKIIAIGILLILMGCGDNGTVIYKHHVSVEQLTEMCGYNCFGLADWRFDEKLQQRVCHVFLWDKWEYGAEVDYHQALGHEVRHCFEGDYH